MKTGNVKLFLNRSKLSQLLNLRLNGLALTSLAFLFNCDKMAILHQCRKFQIEPEEDVFCIERIIAQVLPKPQPLTYKIVNGEKINLGRSYKDYLF